MGDTLYLNDRVVRPGERLVEVLAKMIKRPLRVEEYGRGYRLPDAARYAASARERVERDRVRTANRKRLKETGVVAAFERLIKSGMLKPNESTHLGSFSVSSVSWSDDCGTIWIDFGTRLSTYMYELDNEVEDGRVWFRIQANVLKNGDLLINGRRVGKDENVDEAVARGVANPMKEASGLHPPLSLLDREPVAEILEEFWQRRLTNCCTFEENHRRQEEDDRFCRQLETKTVDQLIHALSLVSTKCEFTLIIDELGKRGSDGQLGSAVQETIHALIKHNSEAQIGPQEDTIVTLIQALQFEQDENEYGIRCGAISALGSMIPTGRIELDKKIITALVQAWKNDSAEYVRFIAGLELSKVDKHNQENRELEVKGQAEKLALKTTKKAIIFGCLIIGGILLCSTLCLAVITPLLE